MKDFKRHIELLLSSYFTFSGKELVQNLPQDPQALFDYIYRADFILLSHGIEEDPVINFANLSAQKLWEMPLEEICCLPSRLTAEEGERAEREKFLKEVREKGYTDAYSGVRISKTGRRFLITDAKVWNVYDEGGDKYGQAAFFDEWKYLSL